jgi:hypothetical protein
MADHAKWRLEGMIPTRPPVPRGDARVDAERGRMERMAVRTAPSSPAGRTYTIVVVLGKHRTGSIGTSQCGPASCHGRMREHQCQPLSLPWERDVHALLVQRPSQRSESHPSLNLQPLSVRGGAAGIKTKERTRRLKPRIPLWEMRC